MNFDKFTFDVTLFKPSFLPYNTVRGTPVWDFNEMEEPARSWFDDRKLIYGEDYIYSRHTPEYNDTTFSFTNDNIALLFKMTFVGLSE